MYHISQDGNLHSHCCKGLKPHMVFIHLKSEDHATLAKAILTTHFQKLVTSKLDGYPSEDLCGALILVRELLAYMEYLNKTIEKFS